MSNLALVLLLMVVCLVLLGAMLGAVVSMVRWNAHTGVPPHPTTWAERRAIIALLREAQLKPGAIYEMGCGFGGLARALARSFPERQIEAYEISPVVAAWARFWGRPLPNLQVHRADLMAAQPGDAAAVVCYLMSEATQKLGRKLDQELSPGSVVLSVVFRFRDRKPQQERSPKGRHSGSIYLYRW